MMHKLVAVFLSAGIATIAAQEPEPRTETMRVRGQVIAEDGKPIAGAQIRTDAIRGPMGAQFAGQRRFSVRTGRNGDWALLGLTRGLWVFEVSAADHLPHVLVVPIAWMLRPESMPWDSSFTLLSQSAVVPETLPANAPEHRVIEAVDRALAGQKLEALDSLRRLMEASLSADALCAVGDVALLLREPAMARAFFDKAASLSPTAYRPQLGIASASMMMLDFDRAMKGYAAARSATQNNRLERMLSGAIRDLQQIRTIGK